MDLVAGKSDGIIGEADVQSHYEAMRRAGVQVGRAGGCRVGACAAVPVVQCSAVPHSNSIPCSPLAPLHPPPPQKTRTHTFRLPHAR